MLDKEILDELIDQKAWWEKCIKETTEKLENFKKEAAKTNRLIEVFQKRIKTNEVSV